MKTSSYLTSYECARTMSWRDVPDMANSSTLDSVKPKEIYADSRNWSDAFSSLLYSHLAGGDTPTLAEFQNFLLQYQNWVFQELPKANARIQELSQDEDFAKQTNLDDFRSKMITERHHASFHDLNIGFFDTWATLLDYKISTNRRQALGNAGFSLVMKGCKLGALRDGFIQDADEAAYFESETSNGRKLLESTLNEIDAGIVLIEFVKSQNQGLMVLPGPSAFETMADTSGSHQTNANADFIIIDPERGHSVGIQVKSTVTDETLEKYDEDRIVLLDTRIDLGNQAAKRTERRRSDTKIVGWAGLISVEAMNRVSPKSAYGKHLFQTRQLGLKQYARRNAVGLSPQLSAASVRIGERILEKL